MKREWGRRRGFARWVPLVASLPLLLGACSGQELAPKVSPYAADMKAAAAQAGSDFERAVFADGVISRAEYDEASQRYLTCMRLRFHDAQGKIVLVQTDVDGAHTYSVKGTSPTLSDDYDTFDAQCRKGTIELIEPLYVGMMKHPQKEKPDQQSVDCLKRHGVVPPSYTVDNWLADFDARSDGKRIGDPAKKTSLNVNSAAVLACLTSPQR